MALLLTSPILSRPRHAYCVHNMQPRSMEAGSSLLPPARPAAYPEPKPEPDPCPPAPHSSALGLPLQPPGPLSISVADCAYPNTHRVPLQSRLQLSLPAWVICIFHWGPWGQKWASSSRGTLSPFGRIVAPKGGGRLGSGIAPRGWGGVRRKGSKNQSAKLK